MCNRTVVIINGFLLDIAILPSPHTRSPQFALHCGVFIGCGSASALAGEFTLAWPDGRTQACSGDVEHDLKSQPSWDWPRGTGALLAWSRHGARWYPVWGYCRGGHACCPSGRIHTSS